MQQIDGESAQLSRLVLVYLEKEWFQVYNELQEQKIIEQKLTSQWGVNKQKDQQLKMTKIKVFHKIQIEKQRRFQQNTILLTRGEQKFQQHQNVSKIAKQDQLSFTMPQLQLELKDIENPKHLSEVIQEYKGNFEKQKAIMEQQIMKLRIVIKLYKIKGEEGTVTASKSKISQTSNNARK